MTGNCVFVNICLFIAPDVIGREFTVYFFCMYGHGFLSPGFTGRREILHGGLATSQTGLVPFWGIAPGMAELWASTEAIWRDMLLAEALVCFLATPYLPFIMYCSHKKVATGYANNKIDKETVKIDI